MRRADGDSDSADDDRGTPGGVPAPPTGKPVDRLDEPAEGARVGTSVAVSGATTAGTVAVCVERAGGGSVRLPLSDGRFAARLPLWTHERGASELVVWAIDGGGGRRLLGRRHIAIDAPPLRPRALLTLAGAAVGKAWRAAREGRLPPSPRAWLRLWRAHLAEHAAAEREAATLAPARALASADAAARLADFMASGARLRLPRHEAPALSVVVVSYDRPELLLACLRSIVEGPPAGSLPPRRASPSILDDPEVPCEVIVVDNGSRAPTQALLARLDGLDVVRRPDNAGFLLAANEGAARARAPLLLMLNSDAALAGGSLRAALAAARLPNLGVVGGRLVHPDGRLQEAGVVVFADGGVGALGRGAVADDPAWDVRRDVDAVSGALLLTPTALFRELGGFDVRYRPAYYEDIDYCVRVRARGLRVLVEPDLLAWHHEAASAVNLEAALAQQTERRPIFVAAHRDWLRGQPAPTRTPRWRAPPGRRRVLFVDDRLPLARYGAGHPRAAACVQMLVEAGHAVTAYATLFPEAHPGVGRDELPREVERAATGGVGGLAAFLAERARDFDVVWVSRAHNHAHLRHAAAALSLPPIIFDAEALREAPGEAAAVRAAAAVVVVSQADAARLPRASFVVGHALQATPGARAFAERAGLLFVGAFHEDGSPNVAAAERLVRGVLPRLRQRLGPVALTLAGARPTARVLALAGDGVAVHASPPSLAPFYDEARVLLAPLTSGAGLPYKLHEAAAHGLPIVTTPHLARLLGWRDGVELLSADSDEALAAAAARLYGDAASWSALRAAALARVGRECDAEAVRAAVAAALAAATGGA